MSAGTTVILSISRQLGSGGAYVGRAVARCAGVRYVDREILQQAAALASPEDEAAGAEDAGLPSVWMRIASICAVGPAEAPYVPPPLPHLHAEERFALESRIVREIVGQESAVLVGRAGAYLPRDHPNLISAFLHAPLEWRIGRVVETYAVRDREEARGLIERSDRQRARFAQSFHGRTWTDACHYDICLDTAAIGLEKTVELLSAMLLERMRKIE